MTLSWNAPSTQMAARLGPSRRNPAGLCRSIPHSPAEHTNSSVFRSITENSIERASSSTLLTE